MLFITLLSIYSVTSAQEQPATVIYSPTITITPDEGAIKNYPARVNVKLLLSENGKVEDVYFAENTAEHVRNQIRQASKLARFTPYKINNKSVKSIVPFTMHFHVMADDFELIGDYD